VSARENISPCESIDDFDPYKYQQWYAGVGGVARPVNCHQT
jgi:hypothetical protein